MTGCFLAHDFLELREEVRNANAFNRSTSVPNPSLTPGGLGSLANSNPLAPSNPSVTTDATSALGAHPHPL